MQFPALYVCLRFAMAATILATSTACHRQPPTTESESELAAVRGADSAKRVSVERSRSSASQAVDFDEAERNRYTRVEQMIQARFSGVNVMSQGGGFTIQIRGTGSFGSSNEPLVIIDGTSKSIADLRGVSPLEVMRIEIFKDAAASFYGSRGANGVIVIKTRRGH